MPHARFGSYRTGRAEESLILRGPVAGPQLLIVPPLFEEANRCRALIAEVQRVLARDAIGSALLDLPGTGDSVVALEQVTLAEWVLAVLDAAALLGPDIRIASFRGGALVDHRPVANGWWRLSPVDGAALIRDLDRAQQVAAKRDGASVGGARAGYPVPPLLAEQLAAATCQTPPRVRTVRLETEAAPADARIAGTPLWRRPEPDQDRDFATRIARDIAGWMRG